MTIKWICPVCDEDFNYVSEADRHYDVHKPSEYIAGWKVKERERPDIEVQISGMDLSDMEDND